MHTCTSRFYTGIYLSDIMRAAAWVWSRTGMYAGTAAHPECPNEADEGDGARQGLHLPAQPWACGQAAKLSTGQHGGPTILGRKSPTAIKWLEW